MQRLMRNYTKGRATRRYHTKHDLVTLSDLPKKWQRFCDGRLGGLPHKFSYETENWAFQDAYFLCETEEEAKEKYQELVDILTHHDGVYIGKKAKKKARTDAEHRSEKGA
jgi:hypothetical protein